MLVIVLMVGFITLNTFPTTFEVAWGFAFASVIGLWLTRGEALAIPRMLAKVLLFPTLMIVTSLHGFYDHPMIDGLKDLYYFSGPLIYTSFGYFLFERAKKWEGFLQPFILSGFVTGIHLLVVVGTNWARLLITSSGEEFRDQAGIGSPACVIPIVLLVFAGQVGLPRIGVERYKFIRVMLYALLGTATLLSFSRTLLSIFLVGFLLMLKPRSFLLRLTPLKAISYGMLLLCLGFGCVVFGARTPTVISSFASKIGHSGSEVTVRHYDTYSDIENDWRGFEASRALRTYGLYNGPEHLFGGGLGATADLGFAMYLFSSQHLPITHNGFAYILFKSGALGLVWFGLFIFQVTAMGFHNWRSEDKQQRFSGYLLIWTGIVFVLTQFVITGIYNKAALANSLILFGAACASLQASRQQGAQHAGQPFPAEVMTGRSLAWRQ